MTTKKEVGSNEHVVPENRLLPMAGEQQRKEESVAPTPGLKYEETSFSMRLGDTQPRRGQTHFRYDKRTKGGCKEVVAINETQR